MEEKTKPRLLVVDDERPIRKLLERIALRAGFEVDTANDGAEALEKLALRHYDIAIVDLMMPRVTGYELVQAIATLQPRPAVIVATALMHGQTASLDDSMVRRVIRKPFDIAAVAATLVETARQIADQQAKAETLIPVAPPESATLPVASREDEVEEPAEPDGAAPAAEGEEPPPRPEKKA